jgi:hypothetical protein
MFPAADPSGLSRAELEARFAELLGLAGSDCRDAFLGFAETSRKPGVAFWDYLGATIEACGALDVLLLADLFHSCGQPSWRAPPGDLS